MHEEYSNKQIFINNLPYSIMILLGSVILLLGNSLLYAAIYFLYGVIGTMWIIMFMCPYCGCYGSGFCPCGYGLISSKIVSKGDINLFSRKFKIHIPVIVPLWFIPVVAAVIHLIDGYSTWLLVLVIIFSIDAFGIVPFSSRAHGCMNCPSRDKCPWMKK